MKINIKINFYFTIKKIIKKNKTNIMKIKVDVM